MMWLGYLLGILVYLTVTTGELLHRTGSEIRENCDGLKKRVLQRMLLHTGLTAGTVHGIASWLLITMTSRWTNASFELVLVAATLLAILSAFCSLKLGLMSANRFHMRPTAR